MYTAIHSKNGNEVLRDRLIRKKTFMLSLNLSEHKSGSSLSLLGNKSHG